MGSRIIESAAYCNQILLAQLHMTAQDDSFKRRTLYFGFLTLHYKSFIDIEFLLFKEIIAPILSGSN
jgi:hypothetical protein